MSLLQNVEIINYAKDHPSAAYRKVAENFNIERTQAQKILKERDAILATYESNTKPNEQKRVRKVRECE